MKKYVLLLLIFVIGSSFIFADTIILKDEQVFEADVTTFDAFYLTVTLTDGQKISIPWGEVRYIKHTTTGSSWLEETYMHNEDIEVKTLVKPLSKDIAFQKSLFPGFVIHGAGHFYGKDQNRGMSLVSAEILSMVLMGISIGGMLAPEDVSGYEQDNISPAVFYTGIGIFIGSWLFDMIFSGNAVDDYNSKNTFYLDDSKKSEEKLVPIGEQ